MPNGSIEYIIRGLLPLYLLQNIQGLLQLPAWEYGYLDIIIFF